MFEREVRIFVVMRDYLHRLVADLDDAQLATQPSPDVNHAAWILGHLALCNDYMLKLLGRDMQCPTDWHPRFGPGSRVVADRSAYPGKQELVGLFDTTADAALAQLAEVRPEQVAGPHPVEFLREALPTAGDLVAHLLTAHIGIHLGQLSAWRRQMGLPAAKL